MDRFQFRDPIRKLDSQLPRSAFAVRTPDWFQFHVASMSGRENFWIAKKNPVDPIGSETFHIISPLIFPATFIEFGDFPATLVWTRGTSDCFFGTLEP